MRKDVNGYVLAAKATLTEGGQLSAPSSVVGKVYVKHQLHRFYQGLHKRKYQRACGIKKTLYQGSLHTNGRVALKSTLYTIRLVTTHLTEVVKKSNVIYAGSASVRSWLRWRMWQPL